MSTQNLNGEGFRNQVIPRAQLSMVASTLAVEKAGQKNAKEFAGFELDEATRVVKVFAAMGTAVPVMNDEGKAFIEKLKGATGNEFDRLYMQAELSNHEFLRDLAKDYVDNTPAKIPASELETYHIATLVLFAFNEHVALCKRIYGEVTA
jgi:putative membrane protein